MNAAVFGVEGVFHTSTPTIVMIMPRIGRRGTIGQRRTRRKLAIALMAMRKVPANSRASRVKKPTVRETRRSINI